MNNRTIVSSIPLLISTDKKKKTPIYNKIFLLFLFYTFESDHISIWINLYDSFKKTFLYFSSRIKKDYSFLSNLKKKKN